MKYTLIVSHLHYTVHIIIDFCMQLALYLHILLQYIVLCSPNTTEMYGDGPTTESRELRDEVKLPPVVYMVRPTPGKV